MAQPITVTREDHGNQGGYYAAVPGTASQAVLTWTLQGNIRQADHTFVPDQARGKGIAMALVQALVSDARDLGFRIDPQCSYVAAAFRRHPEWSGFLA
jgi:predicted GNAT family acetyltransferase